ncbi:hypothetical protein [Halomonas sp. HG01]|uniref:hypothetical protein n=1 Tax=Halomonas sp. HG01 TaxID=1609967 RepID=UPI000B14507F|nr:hypothetical protein [Halomonas sp. HG01]
MKGEKSNQKVWIYRLLIVGTLAASGASVGFYMFQFAGNDLSTDSGAWADFGAYLSGTVGVAAVTFTLFALILTLRQQDSIIEAQEEQIAKVDNHQRKIEAYSRAEKFFPTLRSSMNERLGACASAYLKGNGFPYPSSDFIPESATFGEIIYDYKLSVGLEESGQYYTSAICSLSVAEFCRLLIFVTECIEDAPELYDYFKYELSDVWHVIRCSHAFHKDIRKKDFERVRKALRLPEDYCGLDKTVAVWQGLGAN